MPGFLAAVMVQRSERTGAVVLANTSAGLAPEGLALDLACEALESLPRVREPWRADEGAPPDVEAMLGRWWSEGAELLLTWDRGRLRLEALDGAPGRNLSWLIPETYDRWRIVEGRERGEQLRVVRDDAGAPAKLYVATYPLTRLPAAFADVAAKPS